MFKTLRLLFVVIIVPLLVGYAINCVANFFTEFNSIDITLMWCMGMVVSSVLVLIHCIANGEWKKN